MRSHIGRGITFGAVTFHFISFHIGRGKTTKDDFVGILLLEDLSCGSAFLATPIQSFDSSCRLCGS